METNWHRAATGAAIALLGISVSFGHSSPIRSASTDRGTARHQASKLANGRRKSTAIALTVHVLPTSDGMNGNGMYANRYPKSISIRDAGSFANQIAAYGGAYHVWIGPKGWTGSAGYGVDGSAGLDIYPVGGSALAGPRINFGEIPACMACMLGGAAPYFPNAKREYEKLYRVGPPSTPPGLQVVSLSPTLVTYSLPDEGSLMVRGVVYYKGPYNLLEDARFVLPHADAKLLNFLMHTFIRREKLK